MTTQEDWAFRAAHLRDSANRLDREAKYLTALAADRRRAADRCQQIADTPQEAAPGEMDEIERNAAALIGR
jgi:hypothetical protein